MRRKKGKKKEEKSRCILSVAPPSPRRSSSSVWAWSRLTQHDIYTPAHRKRGERNWRAINFFSKSLTHHIPLAKTDSRRHLSLKNKSKKCRCSLGSTCAAKTRWWGGSVSKGSKEAWIWRQKLKHLPDRPSISAPVLGPPPRLLLEHLTPKGGFIRVLQCYSGCFFNFPNSGPGFRLLEPVSAFAKNPSVLQHPKFRGCCLLLISFSLKMYSSFNKTFYTYFSGVRGENGG